MAEQINADEWQEKVLDSEIPVLVDFYATWCGPCKTMAPVIDEIAAEKAGQAAVYKLDIDENMEIAKRYKVMSIPTFISFKNGEVVTQALGVQPKENIEAMLA